jgi:hypothetical protein
MTPAVTGQENYLPPLEFAGNEDIRGIAEWCSYLNLVRVGQAGHRVQPAPAYDSDFRLLQERLRARVNLRFASSIPAGGWRVANRRSLLFDSA